MERMSVFLVSLLMFIGFSNVYSQELVAEQDNNIKSSYTLFIGVVDFARANQSSVYGIEYIMAKSLTSINLYPKMGFFRTRHGSHYLYMGVTRESYFFSNNKGPLVSIDFAPGIYLYGNGEDTNLGFWLEFRSGASIFWEFDDNTRLGVGYHHLSNASIVKANPGTETIIGYYSVRL